MKNISTGPAEDFMHSSGGLQWVMLDTVGTSLRRKLTSQGAVCHVYVWRGRHLHVRALLAKRWQWATAERIQSLLVSAIWAINPYTLVESVRVSKRGRYIEASIGLT